MAFIFPIHLVMLLGVSFSAAAAPPQSSKMDKTGSNKMDKTGWITHCVGRFLIDLPPQADVTGADYYLWDIGIERLYETPASLASKIDLREKELRAQAHNTQGNLFIRRVAHSGGSTTLLSWDRYLTNDTTKQWMDVYFVAREPWQAYRYSGELEANKQKTVLNVVETLARSIRSREPNAIPTGPGFCIDRAFIAGDAYRLESARVEARMHEPGIVQLSFRSLQTTEKKDTLLEMPWPPSKRRPLQSAEKGTLLERSDKSVDSDKSMDKEFKQLFGVTTLRRGKHHVGPITAEEYLIAIRNKRGYVFMWEAQGMKDSLAHPILSMELSGYGRDTDPYGNPLPPIFKSDREALDLWDAIINSIRLRPGAVGKTP